MNRLSLLLVLFLFSCNQQESDTSMAILLNMTNSLEINNKHLAYDRWSRIEMIDDRIRKKKDSKDYKPLLKIAYEIREITFEYTNYLDEIDRRLFLATGYELEINVPIRNLTKENLKNFSKLPSVLANNKELARDFFNKPKKGFARTIRQTIIDSTLATQSKMTTFLMSLKQVKLLGMTREEADSLGFAMYRLQSNNRTNLQKMFEGKTVAECHIALILLQNEALGAADHIIRFLDSKINTHTFNCIQPKLTSYPSKLHFKKGDTFETEIYVTSAAWYRDTDIKMEVNGDSIAVNDGIGLYKGAKPQNGKYKAKVSMLNPFTGKWEKYAKTYCYDPACKIFY